MSYIPSGTPGIIGERVGIIGSGGYADLGPSGLATRDEVPSIVGSPGVPSGNVYTNSTGGPLQLLIVILGNYHISSVHLVNGSPVSYGDETVSAFNTDHVGGIALPGPRITHNVIVPSGWSYYLVNADGPSPGSVQHWFEVQ